MVLRVVTHTSQGGKSMEDFICYTGGGNGSEDAAYGG